MDTMREAVVLTVSGTRRAERPYQAPGARP